MNTEEFVKSIMKSNNAHYNFSVSNETDVEINIDFGDWKHDHLFVDKIMKENGFEKTDEEVTGDDGCDVYGSIHRFKKIEIPTIVERSHDKESDDIMEYKFSNGAWVKIDLSDSDNCCYEYQSDEDDEETYMSGCLEFENKVLVGYDGCFELPKEVVEAVRDLGHKIDI